MRYYRNVFDLGDLKTALQEAFEIKQDRYKYESLGKHKTCLLIFFNNSLRTRLSTQKAARNLGMDVIVLVSHSVELRQNLHTAEEQHLNR